MHSLVSSGFVISEHEPAHGANFSDGKLESLEHAKSERGAERIPGKETGIQGIKRPSSVAFLHAEEEQRNIAVAISGELRTFASDHGVCATQDGGADDQLSVFKSPKPLSLSLDKYVHRLMRYLNKWAEESDAGDSVGVTTAIAAIILLRRSSVRVILADIHLAFLAAFTVAMKLIYDFYVSNKYFADVGGVSGSLLYELESAMCATLKWDFAIIPDAIEQARCDISRKTAPSSA